MVGPLTGMRVIEWTVWQQGPVAGAMLGDLGAEVIKIEECETGDPGRNMYAINGIDMKDMPNAYFEINNRNKKSLAINLKSAEGIAIVQKLIAGSDIFIHNFRPGIPERLGLDYDTLKDLNPRLIYAAASAFGAKGPERSARAYDTLGSARSGMSMEMAIPGTDAPVSPNGAISDQMGAIMLAYGVLAAVVARHNHGVGQRVDTSLLGSMMWLQGLQFAMQLLMGRSLSGNGERRANINPVFNHYRCADGKWIAIAMVQSDKYWRDFAEVLEHPALVDDPRFADHFARLKNGNACTAELTSAFMKRDRADWLERLSARADFPVCPVNTIEEAANDPQCEPNGYVADFAHPTLGPVRVPGFPVQLSETPLSISRAAPELGQNTEELLLSHLEMSWEEIGALREKNVI